MVDHNRYVERKAIRNNRQGYFNNVCIQHNDSSSYKDYNMKTAFLWFYGIFLIVVFFGAYDVCRDVWTGKPLDIIAQIAITFAILLLCLHNIEYFLEYVTKWLKTRV